MIQANELRVGNWVEFSTGVDGRRNYKCQWLPNYFNLEDLDEPYPITLTTGILEKCGFTSCPYDKGLMYCPKRYYQIYLGYPLVFRTPGTSLANVQYLHQLQNLYFALTGTELNYKL